jgi:hypothetical protein
MTKQKSTESKGGKTGRFIVGRDAFEKISAVEGIRLTPPMKKRANDARAKGLSASEYRESVIRSHRKD